MPIVGDGRVPVNEQEMRYTIPNFFGDAAPLIARRYAVDFIVRQVYAQPDTMLVRYDCTCGCKPAAEIRKGSTDSGSEHCCCGHVHFVGPNARKDLDAYLADRATRHLDDDVKGHTIHETEVASPWGNAVPVAYGLANAPRKSDEHGHH